MNVHFAPGRGGSHRGHCPWRSPLLKVVGKRLDEINLPEGTTIGAIVRRSEVLIAHDHLRVQPDDHVILFLVDKTRIREVEKLFQVGLTFF